MHEWLIRLSGIPPVVIARADARLRQRGILAVLPRAFAGTPFKIYAVESGTHTITPAAFVIANVLTRFARFALSSLIAALLFRKMPASWTLLLKLRVLLAGRSIFYAVYFSLHRG